MRCASLKTIKIFIELNKPKYKNQNDKSITKQIKSKIFKLIFK